MTSRRSPRSNALPAEFVQRAKIVLLLADSVPARAVETKIDVSRRTIAKLAPAVPGARAWRA